MKYAYYPGCSLRASAEEYDVSCRESLAHLGVELVEPPDWTCCGASAVEPVSGLLSYALPARNLPWPNAMRPVWTCWPRAAPAT
jgi:heterodisulfide reductase subunit B